MLDPEQHWRIEEFVDALRRYKESVDFLGLTLTKLLSILILPEADEPRFVELVQDKLGLASRDEQLARRL